MEKLVYGLWRRPDQDLDQIRTALLERVAPTLLDLQVDGLRINVEEPAGKILRVNTDGSIPADNPHGTTVCGTTWGTPGTTCGEIYADGLRNPFRLGFKDDDPNKKMVFAKRAELPTVVTLPDYSIKNLDKSLSTLRDKTVLVYQAANRDETVFADPDRFDITRSPNPHVGFGSAGPHFCLGAHLARREIKAMLRELLTRVPDIRTAGEPD